MTKRITTLIGAAAVVASALAAHSHRSPSRSSRGPRPRRLAPIRTRTTRPGASGFPLAAPAGADSKARETPPAGAVNQGRFDPATWKYGTAFDPPKGKQVWNPVRIKMQQGGKVTGATLFGATDPSVYCAMANAGYDFIWTEMQHDQRDWQATARMWRTCAQAKAVPGVRIAYTDEREIQHALDAGALVLVVPTVDTVEEAREVVEWAYFPPMGRRSNGGGQAFDAAMWGGVPGGYRNTINDNLVVILMIETLEGLKNAEAIAKVPGVTGSSPPAATWPTSPAIARAIRTTSGPSTSCTTPRWPPGCGCAGPSPGATGPTSPASRMRARPRSSPAARRRSWGRSSTPRASRPSAPTRRPSNRAAPRACCGTPARSTAAMRRRRGGPRSSPRRGSARPRARWPGRR